MDELNVVGAPTPDPEPELTPTDASAEDLEKVGEPDKDGDADANSEATREHKRKGGWQRKIERLEQEKEFLMQELLKRNAAPEPKPAQRETAVADPDAKPNPDKFETVGEYIEALSDWKVRQALKAEKEQQEQARKQSEQKTEEQQIAENWQKRVEAGKKSHPEDFEDVLQTPVYPQSQKGLWIQKEIQRSEVADELAYHFGSNPEEAKALFAKPEAEILRSIGRLEARFAQQESAEEKEPPATSRAPKPTTPLPKAGSAAKAPDIYDPNLSFKEYVKLREAQIKGRK